MLELQALALREPRFDSAATAVLAALALRLGCVRVSLAVRRGARSSARILATSDGIDSDSRLEAMRTLADAADEAMDRSDLCEAPPPPQGAAIAAVAHAALLQVDGVAGVLGMAFDAEPGLRAALILELRRPPGEAARGLARDAALFVGPILLMKAQLDAPLWERVDHWMRPHDRKTGRRALAPLTVLGLAAVIGLASAGLWPSTHHVVAQARIEGLGQRIIPAPMDGFLQSVAVRPGAPVKAGQVLAQLDDRETALQSERTAAERQQTERQYLDALTREDAAATEIARARFEQAKAADELSQARQARSRLVAPFDGVLISGDLASQLGSPVKRGQELMVVAPSQAWRVVAEVDEHDVTLVAPGQSARLLLAALAEPTAAFTISRISPVAQPVDGRNVFEAEGRIEAVDGAQLRPGLQGIVRIEAGERAPLAVWWQRAVLQLRRLAWTFMA
ncbi:MAG: HlyD family efflux transporter periplasmic adaptor subunit [Rubrivivax sp.]|nr:HlyD family efflux transporter periplasmic adaptor subunit [Rubrivivax sp.]